jgi:hypothetical protein
MAWVSGIVATGLGLAGCYSQPSADDTETDGSTGAATAGDPSSSPDDTASTDPTTPTNPTDPTDPTDTDPTANPTTDGSDTGPAPACDGPTGEIDAACPVASPFCVDGTCSGCEDVDPGACMAADPTHPACGPEGGACVACVEHDECATGACRIATGECFPAENRLWVDGTAGNCGAATGTEIAPFCDIVTAVDVVSGQVGEQPWAIFVAGAASDYVGAIDPSGDHPLAVIGPDAGLAASVMSPTYAVDLWAMSPETYLSHLTLSSNGTSIVRGGGSACDAWFDDVAIVQGEVGIDTGSCTIRTRRSVLSNNYLNVQVDPSGTFNAIDTDLYNSSGGLMVQGTARLVRSLVRDHYVEGGIDVSGDLTLINSFVYNNVYVNNGIFLHDGGTLDMVYSTLVGRLDCAVAGPSSVRNSIAVENFASGGITCASVAVDDSVVVQGDGQGAGNVVVAPMDVAAMFVNPGGFDNPDGYHVLPGSVPEGVAVWAMGDPDVDVDGDPRPAVAGASDYAGADVP